jgi:two-component system response regulator AtoC
VVNHDGATTKLLPSNGDGELALLIVTSGTPQVVPLKPGPGTKIGRAPTADITLDEDSLSRHHAVFRLRDGAVEVEDLDSSNGTIVRGQRLVAGKPMRLVAGDAAHLGTVLVVVQHRAGSVAERLRPAASAPSDELVTRIARSSMSVLILGETGVGKEIMAARLHAASTRPDKPFVKLNCAALMTSVLESELFGHERGAFTGAIKDKPGLIESADGGTLFLDEIGEADLGVQVKLLRVLEARETQRIGALRPTIVDVRFVAATNRVPAQQIEAGTLRADLYYRLAGFTITIPPLRERRDELPALVTALLPAGYTLAPEALARLAQHAWPGNVRELRNVLERAVVIADRKQLRARDIDAALAHGPAIERPSAATGPGDPERDRVLEVLEACGGNQTMAAEQLGMSRRSLVYRLQAWGMTRPRRR